VSLIRTCSIPGCFALSQYEKSTHTFHHILITPVDGGFTLEDCLDTKMYPTVDALLEKSPECAEFEPVGNPKAPGSSRLLSNSIRASADDETKYEPLVAAAEGMKIENTKSKPSKDRDLMFAPCHYKNWFYHSKEYYVFVGKMNRKRSVDSYEPIVVSILPESNRFRIIIWSRLGDRQYFFPVDGSKKLKWKNGLPKDINTFIAEKIQEYRGKDWVHLNLQLEYVKTTLPLRDQLLRFETCDPLRAKCFNIGLVYSKEGQTTESEVFNNEKGSPVFEEFLNFLGDKIPLKGWKGYKGDLDIKDDGAGKYSIYRRWKGYEIMFHVSTLLPFAATEKQQIHRKRRIGNDVGTIVFQEGGAYVPPIKSQFLHVYYVVSPIVNAKMETQYRMGVTTVSGVGEFGPELPASAMPKGNDFRDYLFTKVLNGLVASLNHPSLREKIWCRPKESFF